MAHLTIRLFGPFGVALYGELVRGFATDKARALLAYLVAEAGRPHRRESLAGLLWPDYPEASARKSLRTALVNLRDAIGDREADPPYLHISRQTVQFNTEADAWCDVATFMELVAPPSGSSRLPRSGAQAGRYALRDELPHGGESVRRLEEAVELYRGGFLEGFSLADSVAFEDWALVKREQFQRHVLETLHRLAAYHEQHGDYEQALGFAWRQVELDPWQEDAQRQLMRLLASSGQRAAALVQYESLRRTLADELGVEPAAETRALYEHIRADTQAIAQPSEIEPAGAATVPHNLPAQATPFIGRVAELADIAQLLEDPTCRLLTLVGPGGSGKTRLALAAAQGFVGATAKPTPRPLFTHGITFVALQPVASIDHIVPTIASAVGFEFHEASDPNAQLLDYLREKRLLLILDNFEHLLSPPCPAGVPPSGGETGGAELVSQLLSGAPQLKLLVTSREALNLREEWLYQVEGMPFPQHEHAMHIDAQLDAYDAVRLFLERAHRVRHDFALHDEKACVIRVCQLVEGMPLGIELAATWLKRLPCAEIAAEIQRSLDILETDLRGVPDRHRSMRAVFAHSWKLLSPKERDVFGKLSVFRGGFRREAAEEVAGASLRILSGLVDKSILRPTGDGRYEIHELQRQYAAERLGETPGLTAAIRDRHCAYFSGFMDQPFRNLWGAEGKETTKAIESDIDNVRAAWNWAVEHTRIGDLHKSMRGLYAFSWLRAWHQEGERAFRSAVGALRAAEPGHARDVALGSALHFQGAIYLWLGRLQLARERAQESLTILRPLDARPELAMAVFIRGWVAHTEGDRERAEALYLEAAPLLEGTGQYEMQGLTYQALGGLTQSLGDYRESERWYEKALTLAREIDDHRTIANTLLDLGRRALSRGEYARARQLAQEGLAVARAQEFAAFTIGALSDLGQVAEATGELERAECYFQESLATAREWGKVPDIAWSLIDLARVVAAQGDHELATNQGQEALETVPGTSDNQLQAYVLAGLGDIALRSGDYAEAQRLLEESLALYPELARLSIAHNHNALGRVAMAQGAGVKSRRHFHAALQAASALGAPPAMLDSVVGVAALYAQEGDLASALRLALLVMNHPASRAETKERATRLLTQLEAELPADDIATARTGDPQNDLDTVVATLIAQLAAADEARHFDGDACR